MKTEKFPIYIFAYSYGIFSLAMAVPIQKHSLWDWLLTILFNGLVYIIYSVFIFTEGRPKPLTDLLLLVFILFLIAKNYVLFNNYLKTYHRQISQSGNLVLTVLLVMMIINTEHDKINKYRSVVISMLCVMLIIVFVMNIKKFNPVNLYVPVKYNQLNISNITLFDCIIPLSLAINSGKYKTKKCTIGFIIFQIISLSLICIFIFGCLKGDLLYSLSPLQAAFQMTSGQLIKNFDAILNYYLYFSYFSAILLNCYAYSIIKTRFSYTNKWDLLLIAPFVIFYGKISNMLFFIIQTLVVIALFIGKERKKYAGKN